jgi:hypothetical protein
MMLFLALLLMLTLIGINSVMTTSMEVDIAGNEYNHLNSFYAAEAALEKASAELAASYKSTAFPPSPLPSGTLTLGNYTVAYQTVSLGPATQKNLINGAYKGLYALATEYEITATATADGTETAATLQQVVESDLVPLFQFAVFYEEDLEIAPGPPMTLGGRVHTNADLYLQAGNSLRIDSYTTAAGNIIHGPKPGSGAATTSGDVQIMDRNGVYQDMYQGGSWLDSNDPDWVAESISRWGGMVEDKEHGMTQLNLPVVSSGVPEDIIATAADSPQDSYENKADIKIIDGVALYQVSEDTWIDVTADLQTEGSLTGTTFYDAHQQQWVDSWDIDMSIFKDSPYFPPNGIMYTSNSLGGNLPATRLTSASDLGRGFTLCSKNSIYIQGDYNTVDKKPSAIMTDALTILSNSWDDSQSDQALSSRTASETTVNCSYMTGNQNTGEGGSAYNGGFENLPRFLEKWTNVDFNWTGSAVDLWLSQEATSPWSYGSYYTAPNRNWAFDTDLLDPNNIPPGTPLISIFQKTSWREIIAEN